MRARAEGATEHVDAKYPHGSCTAAVADTDANMCDDCLFEVLECLDEPSLRNCRCVARRFVHLDDMRWAALCVETFGISPYHIQQSVSPKRVYFNLQRQMRMHREQAMLEQRANAIATHFRIPLDRAMALVATRA